jgi:trk system potassium uptake protein TrkA
MAHHDTVVEADDLVILFLADRRQVEAVERLFLGATTR